ncbi:MAG: molecular chaperone TorD family protein [Chloroflexi bacterium]|nr:molecular chaperone TorD family protein [Chloroflexota bacterium]
MIDPRTHTNETNPKHRACSILHQVARGRSQVYRWLALSFYAPDAELAHALNAGRIVEDILLATVWLGEDRKKFLTHLGKLRECASSAWSDLASDYQRLFGKSSERVPMRESAYRWREASALLDTANQVALALRQHYEQFGVAPIANHEDLLPVELEFMAFLCECESNEWKNNAAERARQLRLQERTFLDDHLGRWFPEFCRRVSDRAPHPFYTALIFLSDTWLNLEYGPGYVPARSL